MKRSTSAQHAHYTQYTTYTKSKIAISINRKLINGENAKGDFSHAYKVFVYCHLVCAYIALPSSSSVTLFIPAYMEFDCCENDKEVLCLPTVEAGASQ